MNLYDRVFNEDDSLDGMVSHRKALERGGDVAHGLVRETKPGDHITDDRIRSVAQANGLQPFHIKHHLLNHQRTGRLRFNQEKQSWLRPKWRVVG